MPAKDTNPFSTTHWKQNAGKYDAPGKREADLAIVIEALQNAQNNGFPEVQAWTTDEIMADMRGCTDIGTKWSDDYFSELIDAALKHMRKWNDEDA